MTKQLKISDTLSLPLDAVTRRMAILAMSGAGKSNVAVVLAEQMYDAGIPWVAIDPKGDWYGVRAGADGKPGGGLPIAVFGGLHGDPPLEPGSGKYIGQLIVEKRLTCVLDTSEFEVRQDMWRFLADFGEALLRLNRDPLHVFAEEADEYLPQTAKDGGNQNRCLGTCGEAMVHHRPFGSSQSWACKTCGGLQRIEPIAGLKVTSPMALLAAAELLGAEYREQVEGAGDLRRSDEGRQASAAYADQFGELIAWVRRSVEAAEL